MSASSSRGRSSSPFQFRRTSSGSYTSTSSSSPAINGRFIPRSCSSSFSSLYGGDNGLGSRSITPSRTRSDSMYTSARNYGGRTSSGYVSADYTAVDHHVVEVPRSGDSISVTIRFRPLSERELQRGDEVAWCADGDKIVRSQYNPAIVYAFDRVFGPSTSSQDVYEVAASPVVKAAMEGVNGTVFAYGVTSSGKTHTMHGDQVSPGIIPLAIKDVFSIIQDTPGREFLLRVSYLEIYNEVINDLLDPTGQNLRVREDSQGTYVEGIKEEVVLSPGHALSFIAAGEEHRHVGSNNFNLFSSRSHTIFTLMIESSPHGDEYDGVIFSQLNLIDLAGSESSKTETIGLRRKEGSYINKSLLTLGTVIGKLSEGKASHVPYRDSKLTRLLQSSLGGHGHVSLICTVTPASSNMEETHNTLKFASRAKRVEIYASRNKIIDEKSLIKKYQKEITCLKHELDQLRKGMLVGISHDEILSLRQQLEDGQVKMQSRLEEEEEAKAALMSRIQRLTKLILVSTKNTISPAYLNVVPSHQRTSSVSRDDKFGVLTQSSVLIESESQGGCCSPDLSIDINDKCPMELLSSSATPESAFEESVSMSDQMDLLVEQVKMLAGEIAFCSSTLKRLTAEQSMADDPDITRPLIDKLEREIEEKKNQMQSLEQRILDSSEPSADIPPATAPTSAVDMQETITRLSAQCNEKGFELEIKSADNRVLQEQLQNKCSENAELQQKIDLLQQQLASAIGDENELKRNIHFQEMENEGLRAVHVQLSEEISGLHVQNQKMSEEISGLHVQNQKMSEESSYAKELASAAAVELKCLAAEVTKLSMQNSKLEKDLIASCELANSRSRKSSTGVENLKLGRRGRFSLSLSSSAERSGEVSEMTELLESGVGDGGAEDVRKELQVRRQREAALEAALTDKEFAVCGYQRSMDEAKKREAALENDLANMWVLVAQLKKEGSSNGAISPLSHFAVTDPKHTAGLLEVDSAPPNDHIPKEEPLVARLKARVKEMKKQGKCGENGNANITYFL